MEAGQACELPEAATDPPPGLTVTEVAPETDQLIVEHAPELMLPGLAVKLFTTGGVAGGGGAEVTVRVSVLVTLPAALVAVSI